MFPFMLRCFGVDAKRGWLEFTKLYVTKGEDIPDMKQFNNKFKGRKDTLYLFESSNGLIGGGFTSLPFGSKYGHFLQDEQAFVFSVDNQRIFKKKKNEKHVLFYSDRFVLFGY